MTGPFDLHGKTALVTGANRGIGMAFARALARQGARTVIWGRDPARNATAQALLTGKGAEIHARQVDVSDEADVTAGIAAIDNAFGRLDIAVVNAGLIDKRASFVDIDTPAWRTLLATNLDGAFFSLREAARAMIDGGRGGALIVCGSLAVFAGTCGLEHYAAAKGALAAMVKSMAAELGGHGIRVNMIAPGYIQTEGSLTGDRGADIAQRTPLRRLGTPANLEGAAIYLASDAAAFHTGDVLVVDGGWMASLD